MHEKTLFPGSATAHQYNADTYRRHLLSFPMYPFRTLCPRDAQNLLGAKGMEFDQTAPMFPANQQINIKFTRRPVAKLLNYMLPTNLNLDLGAVHNELTVDQRNGALNFSVTTPAAGEAPAVVAQHTITGITINIRDMYLQVSVGGMYPPPPHPYSLSLSLYYYYDCTR